MVSRQLITLKLIESVAPTARLHIRDSEFACGFFRTYWPVLREHESVFYRFSDEVVRDGGELFHRATGFDFVSAHIEALSAVISDTDTLVERDRWRIGLWPERFHCLPSRRTPLVNEAQVAVRTARTKGRVLWASRLDWEKRPELLPQIARRLANAAPGVSIDVFGRAVLGHFDVAAFDGLDTLRYHGPVRRLRTPRPRRVRLFRLHELVRRAAQRRARGHGGWPARDCPRGGGIGEMVIDDDTGVLLPLLADDEAAASAFAGAIARLIGDPASRTRLARGALRRLKARHGADVHADRVRAIFFPGEARP